MKQLYNSDLNKSVDIKDIVMSAKGKPVSIEAINFTAESVTIRVGISPAMPLTTVKPAYINSYFLHVT